MPEHMNTCAHSFDAAAVHFTCIGASNNPNAFSIASLKN